MYLPLCRLAWLYNVTAVEKKVVSVTFFKYFIQKYRHPMFSSYWQLMVLVVRFLHYASTGE